MSNMFGKALLSIFRGVKGLKLLVERVVPACERRPIHTNRGCLDRIIHTRRVDYPILYGCYCL